MFRYLRAPAGVLAVCAVGLMAALYYATLFRFDASSETLVVEGDPDLATYERVVDTFGGDDFLFLTFRPHDADPISEPALQTLAALTGELRAIEGVKSVFSVLDAPLLKSPPMPLSEIADGFRTLQSPGTDLELAREELTQSPFFKELLITADGDASAVKIDLAADTELNRIVQTRDELEAAATRDRDALRRADEAYREAREGYLQDRNRLIEQVRAVKDRYASKGTLHLGGVPMIAADMISYVKRDLWIFGSAVVILMIVTLALFFRSARWIILPIATATLSVVYTIGLLGFLDWQATVISSNFVSLLGITTVSLTIHLIVQYRELQHTRSELGAKEMVFETMRSKFAPCLFTALTTMAAFGSLTASGIVPVEYFGWMMCLGILISFLTTFTFFPAVLLLLPKAPSTGALTSVNSLIRALGDAARWRPVLIVVLAGLLAIATVFGVQRVSLDNRFAEYFEPETEIFQSMRYIDTHLGGTIPFDVVLSFPPYEDLAFDEDEGFGFDDEAETFPERYWFNRRMLDALAPVHRFLQEQPQVGKVMSLTALEDLAREFTDGEPLSNLQIVGILGAIPEDLHPELIDPYASPGTGELRITGRIIESAAGFDRELFRQEIIDFAASLSSFEQDDVTVTGMMVLFNGMLRQLLDSQIDTLSYVLLAVLVMFLVLLRSLSHALLGLIPNVLAAATVIAAMGYAGIPLDMMTTTIAAICVGIGVDDTIHYLHRFRSEYARWGDARVAVSFSHASIGQAMYYTSITVVVGFSVLCFSNFVPTVMFGIWTAVAIGLALLANVTLLPALLVLTHGDKAPDPTVRTESDQSDDRAPLTNPRT